MRNPGDIVLVACYELGHQPLSLAWAAAFLERAGYAPTVVDASVEPLSDDLIRTARFVGISVPMHTALRLGVRIAERIRALNPAAHICMLGLYAQLNAAYLVPRLADSALAGEHEAALVDLVRRLESGRSASGVAAPVRQRLDFPAPRRDGLPGLERYARLEIDGELRLAGYVEASRGCLHTCRHCPITPVYEGRFFVVPRDVVLADIRRQVAAGARHITFGDPDFLNGPGHVLKLLRAMHEEHPGLTFDATIKIEHILEHRSVFPELRRLGCAFVLSAVESVSDLVLERLKKGHTRADIVEALAILREAGIPLRASLIPFTPWATFEDYLDLLDFVEQHGLIAHIDPVQYSIRLLIPPGSALLDQPDTAEWLGDLDAAAFTYRWQHPDPRMDRLHAAVQSYVEAAAARNDSPWTVFDAVRSLAYDAAGVQERRVIPRVDVLGIAAAAASIPRLTEAWFC